MSLPFRQMEEVPFPMMSSLFVNILYLPRMGLSGFAGCGFDVGDCPFLPPPDDCLPPPALGPDLLSATVRSFFVLP
eukprot:CAMPEP_0115724006 /NCGR_PEP_ID=MMETSP0272-20121206/80552_1 /TAXON_ID=71861 /ORGANISM="Scrippsiella trochoidea, Strain CCMP3099" /LENGTH=75 /DNA_ID=CAMNT_0003167209 /DNA_START=136 /DNA_END=359 /DNA_ORIENTATION=+